MAVAADGAETQLAYWSETSWGVAPPASPAPTLTVLRTTEITLRGDQQYGVSNEMQPDRNIRDDFVLARSARGGFKAELTYGNPDGILQAALMGGWSSDVLKNGTTRRSMLLEEINKVDGADSYARFSGAMVDTFRIRMDANQVIEYEVEFLAKKEVHEASALTGATYTTPSWYRVPATAGAIANLTASGLSSGTVYVKSLSLEVKNNLRARPVVDSEYSIEFGIGSFEVTGEITVYFNNRAIYEAIENHATGSLEFTLGKTTNQKYTFEVPNLRWGNGERMNRRNRDDVMARIPFRGVYDSSEACSLKITRAVA